METYSTAKTSGVAGAPRAFFLVQSAFVLSFPPSVEPSSLLPLPRLRQVPVAVVQQALPICAAGLASCLHAPGNGGGASERWGGDFGRKERDSWARHGTAATRHSTRTQRHGRAAWWRGPRGHVRSTSDKLVQRRCRSVMEGWGELTTCRAALNRPRWASEHWQPSGSSRFSLVYTQAWWRARFS